MQEASFSNLIEDIVVILIIYYVIKFLARLFLPVLAKKVVDKASQQFQQQQQQQQQRNQNPQQPEKPRETKKVGDYIDYEEID